MYKVFIENRPILFSEIIPNDENNYVISANEINNCEIDLTLKLQEIELNKNIIIHCSNLEKDFERLFRNYEKVNAAGGIVKRKNKYLFIKRNGFWDIPKGKVENDEVLEAAAVREIEEECGLKTPVIADLILTTLHTYDYHGTPSIKKTYWYALNYQGPKDLIPQEEEGITKVEWFEKSEWGKIRKNTFLSIIEVLDTYLSWEQKFKMETKGS